MSTTRKKHKPKSLSDAQTSEQVDYEKIVDGLNARVTALEAENASLKNLMGNGLTIFFMTVYDR